MCRSMRGKLLLLFSRSVLSNSLWLHGLQQARLPYSSISLPLSWSFLKRHPLSWWCHRTSHALLHPSSSALSLSQHQGLFQRGCSLHQVAREVAFQLQHQSSNEYSGLISFRMDWLDLLAAQGTLKSLLQHHRAKATVLQCFTFFMVQCPHPYMTTEKTIALTR